jgi:hypothetical protein
MRLFALILLAATAAHAQLTPDTEAKVVRRRTELRGGMSFGSWRVAYADGTTLVVTTYITSDGKIEQLLVEGKV